MPDDFSALLPTATAASLPGLPPAASTKTLVGSAYLGLRRDIINGTLPPGTKLRVEHLKTVYGVGAGTLREALALLVSDALVVAEGQRGFHVKPMSMADFYDITETRILLECQALRQAIGCGDDAWEGQVVAAFHRLNRAEKRLEGNHNERFEEWEARNRDFHHALISACRSAWLHHFLAILYHQAERYRRLSIERKPIPRDVHAEHQAILDATLAHDADTACALLTDHIRTTYEAIKQLPQALFEN
ncbi:FCD domain-containing protein [Allopusillimonas soli]|uniref:FCD domain-containing protein n=1 Tax=Allopusillimonas soli TaxID=659016 RepID=A0A853FG64_9BURK|nr:FCD domain-containing protein [Allopusillimonas soli]NYT38658.1 FCD domain-containing protein [Allopusillimonas soli]TEA71636.1 FCD domain-containing protein [Allopusillimonas soli]